MSPRAPRGPLWRGRTVASLLCGFATVLVLILSACGTTSTTGGNHVTGGAVPTSTVSCPDQATTANLHLVTAGQLTIASDTTYAPAEYEDPNQAGHFIGYDMDLAREF